MGKALQRNAATQLPGTRTRAAAALIALTLSPVFLHAATPIRFAGAVSGLVTDNIGKPQPGASVALFNRQDRLLQKAYTDIAGNFTFGDLLPDLYTIQVSLASFVPASRQSVAVRPGMRSLLEVSLSRMFSSIHVVSTLPVPGGLMSDEWKWTLRADSAQRPILRLLPVASKPSPDPVATAATTGGARTAVFHDSSALVRISASDAAVSAGAFDEADLGTQFAFATSVYARNQVQVSGDLGYGSSATAPAAAIRTTFTREIGGAHPTVSVTMRQMNLASHVGQSSIGGPSGEGTLPLLRSLSISLSDKTQLTDAALIEYGSEMDTITFLGRLQYFSPWAKLTYQLPRGHLDMVFTSGNARPGLDSTDPNEGLQSELAALALVPRLSVASGHLRAQRGDDYEVGYSEAVGATEFRVSGYHQYVANSTLTISNPDASLFDGNLLPSMFASSAVFNAGNVSTSGYTLSVTRKLSHNYKLTAAYGLVGVMTPDRKVRLMDAADLREIMSVRNRHALTMRAAGTVKQTGTRFMASYQYSNLTSSLPIASFSTQPDRSDPGLNIMIRQPIPFMSGLPGRVEATAEMRNMLAQGYLPLAMADGRQLLLVNTPRVFRGGLAFVF